MTTNLIPVPQSVEHHRGWCVVLEWEYITKDVADRISFAWINQMTVQFPKAEVVFDGFCNIFEIHCGFYKASVQATPVNKERICKIL